MPHEWQRLRAWNGSQEKAFEELCCQLAALEQMPQGSKFTRKGTPDAGLECFWVLPNGDEWAWQAKFFLQLEETQWRELDDSVEQALSKHPRIVRYLVCVPLDLADPRLVSKKTGKKIKFARDMWGLRAKKWEQLAANQRRQVQFEYWGDHELWLRLTTNENRGRMLFWFNEQWFSDDWFRQRITEVYSIAGKRYIPNLHVELDLERAFEALGRTSQFLSQISERLGSARREFDQCRTGSLSGTSVEGAVRLLGEVLGQLLGIFTPSRTPFEPLSLTSIVQLADRGGELAAQILSELLGIRSKDAAGASKRERYSYECRQLRLVQYRLNDLKELVTSPVATVANTGALLLVGDAGTGKTHLFCEVARRRSQACAPTLLFLAEQFVPGEPWSQMVNILGLRCDRDELLGALGAIAEARGTRAMILIDALNEEQGWRVWPTHLPAMLTELRRHPTIGLAVSVRSSYERSVIPEQLRGNDEIVRFVHRGFEGREEDAVDRYFAHYGIEPPAFPMLDPEFSNPLFLRILCEGIQNSGLSRIPTGLRGFTAVFRFFLDSVNQKLAHPKYLDYDPHRHVVMKAVEVLIAAMIAREADWLPREFASEALEAVLQRAGFDKSLFRCLLDEGVLVEDLMWTRVTQEMPPGTRGASKSSQVVRFQYQRFADYLIVQHLLAPHLEVGKPQAAFEPGQRLARVLADPGSCRANQGLVEALAVILPETGGAELPSLVPHCASFGSVKEAVSASLVWRRATSVSAATWSYAEQTILLDKEARNMLLRGLVLVAIDPEHPYNGRFLHSWLLPMRMVDRDAIWSTFLALEYAGGGAVARLLRWAESRRDRDQANHEVGTLATFALAWFLTSSSRVLRDRATKALVALLQLRIGEAAKLLETFSAANDDYVLERLAAAAYGAAMRCRTAGEVGPLAAACYEQFFKSTRPPVNALTRDYLRGMVELAIHLREPIAIEAERIRPSYGEPLPQGFASGQRATTMDRTSTSDWPVGLRSVYDSVTNHDFSWYVLRDLCGSFLAARLEDPVAPRRRETYDAFEKGLSATQATAWEKYRGPRLTITELRDLLPGSAEHETSWPTSFTALAREEFEATLSPQQLEVFRREIRPYVEEGLSGEERPRITPAAVQDFILNYVVAIGWRQELDDFDTSAIISSSDMRNEVERIGKKYQWIAFYRLIGLLADNFQFTDENHNTVGSYEGPWQIIYGRNIDPSLLIRSKSKEAPGIRCWWEPKPYDSWADEVDEITWLSEESDLPDVLGTFLCVKDLDREEWLVLEGDYKWTQPPEPGRRYLELPQRQIHYNITSCLVRREHGSSVLKSLLSAGLPRESSLEPRHLSEVFLGEMNWAPIYVSQMKPYYGYEEWTTDSLPHPVLVTTEHYYAEPGSYDGSMDESVTLPSPAHWIVEKMGLKWNGVEGEWCVGTPCRTIFSDPSAQSPGPTALLGHRKELEHFLEEQHCSVVWIITGTKWALGGGMGRRPTGRRLISGAACMSDGKVRGGVRSWLEVPRRTT
jgi:hypothetical protein